MLAAAAEGRPLQIIVKVDRDGDAGTTSETDLLGVAESDVRPGGSGIVVPVAATLGEIAAAVGEELPDTLARSETPTARSVITGTIILPALSTRVRRRRTWCS